MCVTGFVGGGVYLYAGDQMHTCRIGVLLLDLFFFKQKTAYEVRISDWSSDVCSSDLCRLSFAEGREALEERFPAAELVEGGDEFSALLKQVVDAVEAPVNGFDPITIDVKGTAFQEAVWREPRKITAGETRSYLDIAAAVGKTEEVRAAGSAKGDNNYAVPNHCHRD